MLTASNSRKERQEAVARVARQAVAQGPEQLGPEAPHNWATAAIPRSGHNSLRTPEAHIRTEPDKRTARSRKECSHKGTHRTRSRVRCWDRSIAARCSRHKLAAPHGRVRRRARHEIPHEIRREIRRDRRQKPALPLTRPPKPAEQPFWRCSKIVVS
jgi:hypothetical protein